MLPEVGHFSLILSLYFALTLALLPLYGLWSAEPQLMASGKRLANGLFFFLSIAYVILTFAFVNHDFSVAYVANNSSLQLPLLYRVTAVWGSHEGSILLWALILSGWTMAVAHISKALPDVIRARVLSILGMVSVCFLSFILITSNPFLRLFASVPENGRDLNPLLQDPGFFIHPPLLYMGYVGFSVTFALVIACLWTGELDKRWAEWSRPWVLSAWSFLTAGITLGSWWAYRELGWGGWWSWDPVENASFLPWLAGTALCHSLLVVEKRNTFKAWTAFLAIAAFSLSLMGTFLVRSGILTSVHAFAVDPKRGMFMLAILCAVIASSLLVYAMRAHRLNQSQTFSFLSRESLLLSNNVLLAVSLATILMGTVYPLIIEAMSLGKLSVGAPYFNAVLLPLTAPLLLFMAMGPQVHWQQMPPQLLLSRLKITFLVSLGFGIVLPALILQSSDWRVYYGLGLAALITTSTVQTLLKQYRASLSINWGMGLAHLGIACLVFGITIVTQFSQEKMSRVAVNDTITIAGYQLHFISRDEFVGPNYQSDRARFDLTDQQGNHIATLFPEKRFYTVTQMVMTDSAVDAGLFRDIYLALGESYSDHTWSVRVYYKPAIRFIWLGGLLMLLGGIMALRTSYRKELNHEN